MKFFLGTSWQKAMEEELEKPYLTALQSFVLQERALLKAPVYPPVDLVFSAFIETPFEAVKVVVVGQDPYHGPGQAHGLSFSVPEGEKIPPSLQNIFKELQSDIGISPPSHGCLLSWARQGVLLLNSTLTVRQGEPLSHQGRGWENFTDAVLQTLAKRKDPVIFVLWGKFAQAKSRFISPPHIVLTAAHPSPLSAHSGFFGCRHFSAINEALKQQGKKEIVWG